MRRLAVSTVMLLVTSTLVAGCQQQPSKARALSVPSAGVCHRIAPQQAEPYQPIDCTESHEAETVHVGTFDGVDAGLAGPPKDETSAQRRAYDSCDAAVRSFLGGDWREARLTLRLLVPSKDGWSAGERWFRCDLSEIAGADQPFPIPRAGTLAKALGTPSSLRFGCHHAAEENDRLRYLLPATCTDPHNSEFVGVWTAPDVPYAELGDQATHRGCGTTVASYAGVPDDDDLEYRTGTLAFAPEEWQWAMGERGVRCFLWIDDGKVSRSLKAAGVKGLPIRS